MTKPNTPQAPLPVSALILAGGRSTRMGQDKAELKLGEHTLLERCILKAEQQVDNLVINRNSELSADGNTPSSSHHWPQISDSLGGYIGPLAGILSGLQWLQENTDHDWMISAAIDTPFFPDDLAQQLYQCAVQHPNAQIICPRSERRQHPTFCLWHKSLIKPLHRYLTEENGRRVMMFLKSCHTYTVDFDDTPFDPFFNLNTPEDLTKAEEIADKFFLLAP